MTGRGQASASAAAIQHRIPDFFIVGHPKSGTSALYQMLRTYPQIHMPRKEPSFFVPELWPPHWQKYANGIDDYRAFYSEAGEDQLIGEATTSYLWSHGAAQRIADIQPRARIVAILREPASFLRSLHLQFIRSNVETEPDLRTAIELDSQRAEGMRLPPNSTRPKALVYSEHVRYVEQLRRYHAAFPREQVLVLIYEDFRADNEAIIGEVLDFLGLEDAPPPELIEANHASGLRSPRVHDLVRSLYMGRSGAARPAKAAIKALTPQRLRKRAVGTVARMQRSEPPAVDEQLMHELRVRFKGEVQALSDYLGRDMTARWGYDRIESER